MPVPCKHISGNSSLCLISSLSSLSSSLSQCSCLDAVLLSTRHSNHDPASDSHLLYSWTLLLCSIFAGGLVSWSSVIKSSLPTTPLDGLSFPIQSKSESQTSAFRLHHMVVESWLQFEDTLLEAAIRDHVNLCGADQNMIFEPLPLQYADCTGLENNVHAALNSAPISHLNQCYLNRATWRKEQITEIEDLAISLRRLQVDTLHPTPSNDPGASTSGSASGLNMPQASLRPQRTKRQTERYSSESLSTSSPTQSYKLRQDFVLTANTLSTRSPPSEPPCGHSVFPSNEQLPDSKVKQTPCYVMVGEVKRLHKLCTGDTKVCHPIAMLINSYL